MYKLLHWDRNCRWNLLQSHPVTVIDTRPETAQETYCYLTQLQYTDTRPETADETYCYLNQLQYTVTRPETADETYCYLNQIQYTNTRLFSPTADPIMPGIWQGSHREVTSMTHHGKSPTGRAGIEPKSATLEVDTLPQGQRGGVTGWDS